MQHSGVAVSAAEPWMWWSHASAYGRESVYDGGYWSSDQHRWNGYMERRTSWGWHCALPEHLNPQSPYYSWAFLTEESQGVASRDWRLLGTLIEMRIRLPDGTLGPRQILPVTDGGPYGVWWDWDIQEPVLLRLGWGGVGPSRYGARDGPYYGRRDVLVRYRNDMPRYCPRWGYGIGTPSG